jgi:hypothetical protein
VAINKVFLKETEKEVPSEHDREADEGREAGCLVFSCHCAWQMKSLMALWIAA